MLAAFALTCRDAGSGFNAGVFVTPARKPMLRSYRGDIARVGLKPAAFSTATSLRMMSSEPETKTDVAETIAKKPYEETQAALVQKYVDFLDWKSDTNGFEMQEWRVDNREIKMKSQNITKETAPDRAMEAILRTREKYIAAFMDDGVNRTSAEARADNFLEDSVRSCDIIWKDEKVSSFCLPSFCVLASAGLISGTAGPLCVCGGGCREAVQVPGRARQHLCVHSPRSRLPQHNADRPGGGNDQVLRQQQLHTHRGHQVQRRGRTGPEASQCHEGPSFILSLPFCSVSFSAFAIAFSQHLCM